GSERDRGRAALPGRADGGQRRVREGHRRGPGQREGPGQPRGAPLPLRRSGRREEGAGGREERRAGRGRRGSRGEELPVKRIAIPIAAALVGLALACGQTKVEGSLQEILDLTYQDIKLGFAGDQIAVRWTRPRGSGQDTVLEVSEKLDGLTVRTGDFVNLAEPLPDFALADAGMPAGGLVPDGGAC